MNADCQCIIFSDKAYNSIINETFRKNPLETGGILLGHILDNGIWIVLEVLPPGWKSILQHAYFEYDKMFVNYLAQSIATEYEEELSLLGLWHRHPGSIDNFSNTDNETNHIFADLNIKGAISGIVNIDPKFRLTMYHVSNSLGDKKVDTEIGSDLIPEEYFKLKYFPAKGLRPDLPDEIINEPTNMEKEFVDTYNKIYENKKDNFLIYFFKRYLNTRLLFLMIFISVLTLSLFSLYSYSMLERTTGIKSLYCVFYSEYPNIFTPDTDSVKKKAETDVDSLSSPCIICKVKSINIFLLITTGLSLIAMVIPKKNNQINDWYIVGLSILGSIIITSLLSKCLSLPNHISLASLITGVFIFSVLCVISFTVLFLLKFINFKNVKKSDYDRIN